MDRFVSLAQLPVGVMFPSELQGRVWYDGERKRLYFRGFMSKADFDRLCRAHNDFHFQRALEELFQKCTFLDVTPGEQRSSSRWVRQAAAALAVAVASATAMGLLWLRH